MSVVVDVARRARTTIRGTRQVPRLRLGNPAGPSTVWMVCPDWDRPAGGIRRQYRTVDVLNAAGVRAAIVHRRAGFSCSWFEHATTIVGAGEVEVGEADVIAVPEIYGASILDLPAGVPQVIFNQNAYLMLDSLATDGRAAAAPYVDNADLAAVVVVSDHNAELLRYAFPEAPVKRVHWGIDTGVHHPPATPPSRRIAYMPRRRSEEADQVLALLDRRGALDGWEIVAIDRMTESQVAEVLRDCRLFLSFSLLEGFGLPPLEALACGCLVVGFDGFGGREFFRPPFAVPVENGDVVGFARAAEEFLRRIENDPAWHRAAVEAGVGFVRDHYSPEIERRDILEAFVPLLGS